MDRDRNPNGGVGRGRGRGRGIVGGGGGRYSSGPRGRSSRSSGNSSHDHSGTDRKFDSDSFGSKNANFRSRRQTMEQDNSGYEPPPRWQSQQGKKSPDSVRSTSNELDKRSSQIGHTTDTIGIVSHANLQSGTDRQFDSDSFGSKNANFRSRRQTMEQDNSGYEPPPRWQSQQGKKSPDSVCSTSNELDKRSSQIGHTTDTIGIVSHANLQSGTDRKFDSDSFGSKNANFRSRRQTMEQDNSGYEPPPRWQSQQGKKSPDCVRSTSNELDKRSSQIGHTTDTIGIVSHVNLQSGTDRKFDSDSFGSKNANFRSRRQTMEQDNSGYEPPPRWQSQQGKKSPDSVRSTSNELDKRSSQIGHTTDTIGIVSHANLQNGPDRQFDGKFANFLLHQKFVSNNSGYEPAHSGPERESRQGKSSPKSVHNNSKELDISSLQIGHIGDCHEISHKAGIASLQEESRLPLKSGINDRPPKNDGPQNGQASLGNPEGNRNTEQSEHSATVAPFDICLNKSGAPVMLKPSLLVRNKEKRREIQRSMEVQKGFVLRSGMVLLKNYFSCAVQVKIVKKCQDLGLGFGGFYQPGYRDGAKLHLKMMCLGKNWDPETSKYGDYRPIDAAKPPIIPNEFHQLVQSTIQESHAVIGKDVKSSSVEKILPSMSANICIVNFYSERGRLGLHKDQDESAESLRKGLPVVSFSIGDSAEFLYGDDNNIDKAEKIILESGDAILFGGESRHIYHGVTAILPNTAPKALLEETNLRPGRLNLTFREY